MPSKHNSLCQQFRALSLEARASPGHLRFTISSESRIKTPDELK